jgi:hypothetical protein
MLAGRVAGNRALSAFPILQSFLLFGWDGNSTPGRPDDRSRAGLHCRAIACHLRACSGPAKARDHRRHVGVPPSCVLKHTAKSQKDWS